MNLPQKNVNNLLFIPNSQEEYVEDMYSAILQLILTTNKTIVVLTQTPPKLLPLMEKLKIELHRNKELLQRLIFISCENIGAAIRKLFDLHNWSVKAHIIIIDFCEFVDKEEQIVPHTHHLGVTIVPFLQQLVSCIAALFNMMNALGSNVLSKVFSVVVLKARGTILSTTQVELVQELYYGDSTYKEFKRIVEKLQ